MTKRKGSAGESAVRWQSIKSASAARTGQRGGAAVDARAGRATGRRRTPPIVDGTVKKSVTLRGSVVDEIQARTGIRGFSQFLDEAAARHLALIKAQEIVDDHVARLGEFTDEELSEAQAAWRGE